VWTFELPFPPGPPELFPLVDGPTLPGQPSY
jgi:hypothetical protein